MNNIFVYPFWIMFISSFFTFSLFLLFCIFSSFFKNHIYLSFSFFFRNRICLQYDGYARRKYFCQIMFPAFYTSASDHRCIIIRSHWTNELGKFVVEAKIERSTITISYLNPSAKFSLIWYLFFFFLLSLILYVFTWTLNEIASKLHTLLSCVKPVNSELKKIDPFTNGKCS